MAISTLPLDHLLSSTSQADFPGRTALADISSSIAKARRVVVVSGAGISCSSGIPDFRSADGLYSLVKSRYPDAFFTGKDLFSSGLFSNPSTTSIFYTFIAELYLSCQAAKPTRTHHLIQKLESKGKLLRSYTQNVDGLERRMGLESGGRGQGFKKRGTRNVELHGDLGRVRCVLCMKDYEAKLEWVGMFREGAAPDCPACIERSESRMMRAARATAIGTLRPSIVLYDEQHPLGDDIGDLQTYDINRNPDLLLIMGTSLKVHGLKRVVKEFAKAVHAKNGLVVFVNATPPSKEWEGIIDVHVHGQTDVWAEKVEDDWKRIRPADWEIQTRLDGEAVTVGPVGVKEKVKKEATGKRRVTKAKAEGGVQVKKEAGPRVKKETKPRVKKEVKVEVEGEIKPKVAKSRGRPAKVKPEIQLPPTPRQTASPVSDMSSPLTELDEEASPSSPSSSSVLGVETLAGDCIVALPPTPISPSKRRPTSSASCELSTRGPMKKTKSFNDRTTAPITGLASSSGQGNLFAPRPMNVDISINDTWDLEKDWDTDFNGNSGNMEGIDSSNPFLSPSPSKASVSPAPAPRFGAVGTRQFRRTRTIDSGMKLSSNANTSKFVSYAPIPVPPPGQGGTLVRRPSLLDKENIALGATGRRVINLSTTAV